jgi:hypothetical protein
MSVKRKPSQIKNKNLVFVVISLGKQDMGMQFTTEDFFFLQFFMKPCVVVHGYNLRRLKLDQEDARSRPA